MTEKQLKEVMESYSDERILNNIKQQNFFGPETVEVAKEIALERKIITEDQILNIDQFMKDKAIQRAQQPYTPSSMTAPVTIGTGLIILFIVIRIVLRFAREATY